MLSNIVKALWLFSTLILKGLIPNIFLVGQQMGLGPVGPPMEALGGAPMKAAQMYLQGIEPSARLQLLALCLASLESHILQLHDENIRSGSKGITFF